MTDLFAKNVDIISQRWPILASALRFESIDHFDAQLVEGNNQTISVDGIQLSSRHNRIAEAKLLINPLPLVCDKVTVYGIGMGDVMSLLIDNKQLQSIEVVPLNLSLLALLLSFTDQSEWLSDPRVKVAYQAHQHKINLPNISITPDLLLANNENAILRDHLVLENNRAYVNRQHQPANPEVQKRLNENAQAIANDPDASTLILPHGQYKAHLIGSGPTLENHYDYLRAQRKLPIGQRSLMIAVDTALKALIHENIIPDIVVSIDNKITPAHFPDTIPSSITLVYFPTLSSLIHGQWPGPKYIAYSKNPIYDKLDKQYPKLRLFTNGSVIHPAIDLAVYLNIKEITLFGCDFSYPGNKTHAFWHDGALGPSINNQNHHWVINGHGERVATDLNFRGYLRSLEHYISAKQHVKFYQSSLDGARIHGAQYKDLSL